MYKWYLSISGGNSPPTSIRPCQLPSFGTDCCLAVEDILQSTRDCLLILCKTSRGIATDISNVNSKWADMPSFHIE